MSLETSDALQCSDSPRGMINTAHAAQARGTEGGRPAATTHVFCSSKVELKLQIQWEKKNKTSNLRSTFPSVKFGLN